MQQEERSYHSSITHYRVIHGMEEHDKELHYRVTANSQPEFEEPVRLKFLFRHLLNENLLSLESKSGSYSIKLIFKT